MPAAPKIARKTFGKTLLVASSVLALGALLEAGAVGWAYARRYQNLSVEARENALQSARQAKARALAMSASKPSEPGAEVLDIQAVPDPLAESGPGTPAAANEEPPVVAPIMPPAKPVPVALAKLELKAPPSTRYQELVEQGRILRDRGDMSSALTKLREAQALEPQSPQAMGELALTFEKMGLTEKAAEQWKRVYELGERAGTYYQAASARLKLSQSQALQSVQPADTKAGSSLNPQASMILGEVKLEELRDATSLRKFVLKLPLKAHIEGKVEVRDVAIHVLFYEQLNGKSIVQTNANVNSRWANPPPDWAEGDLEILEVEYQQPRPDPHDTLREDRKYFGYNVRLYYKGELQDARSEPARLAGMYPAPQTLEKVPLQ